MNRLELIDSLIEELKTLQNGEQTKLDAINRRAEMIIRNIFGDDSKYIKDLHAIHFRLMFAPAQEQTKREYWRSGIEEMQNLFNTIKEEIQLFGEVTETKSANQITSTEYFVDLIPSELM